MLSSKTSAVEAPALTRFELCTDVAIGVDARTGGVWEIVVRGGVYRFVTPTDVIAAIDGQELTDWDGRPGNNLVGDRSLTVVGADRVSLEGPITTSENVSEGSLHGVRLVRHHTLGDIAETFLADNGGVISRAVSFTPEAGVTESPLRTVEVVGPGVSPTHRGALLAFPGMASAPGWHDRPLESGLHADLLAEGGASAVVPLMADIGSSLVGVSDGNLRVWAGYVQSAFPATVDVWKGSHGASPVHLVHASAKVGQATRLSLGIQVLGVGETAAEVGWRIRHHLGEIFAGITPQPGQDLTIYEAHIGNKFPDPFAPNDREGQNPYPTVAELVADLPRISSLGFTALQLMPHFPYPGYTIDDYRTPENQYGGSEALSLLGNACSKVGLDLIVDFILHGPVDKNIPAYAPWAPESSWYLTEHPEWFMRAENGRIRQTHTYSFDLAHPDVIDHMVGAMLQLMTRGVTGFRVDAPLWNLFPHWGDGLHYPAGASTMGWVEIIRQFREVLAETGQNCHLIGETAGFLGQKIFDLVYGYDEMGLTRSFVQGNQPFLALGLFPQDTVTARDIRDSWRDKMGAMGPQAIAGVIRHLDSHDSYEWGGLSTWARNTFGPAFPALLVSLATLPGPWMHFTGAEKGCEDLIRDVLSARRHPAISLGDFQFEATSSSHPDLMHHASVCGTHASVTLANLSPHPLNTAVEVDPALWSLLALAATESNIDGVADHCLELTLQPWEYRILQTPLTNTETDTTS